MAAITPKLDSTLSQLDFMLADTFHLALHNNAKTATTCR
jgi:hypothetical protein